VVRNPLQSGGPIITLVKLCYSAGKVGVWCRTGYSSMGPLCGLRLGQNVSLTLNNNKVGAWKPLFLSEETYWIPLRSVKLGANLQYDPVLWPLIIILPPSPPSLIIYWTPESCLLFIYFQVRFVTVSETWTMLFGEVSASFHQWKIHVWCMDLLFYW